MTPSLNIRRLGPNDLRLTRATLTLVAEVFDEPHAELREDYVRALLSRGDFWVVAALVNDTPVGGVTGHALPMTRNESTELFIYDLAVHPTYQRQGIGRALIATLTTLAAAEGIVVSFVPADNDDTHALSFYQAIGGAPVAVTMYTFEHASTSKNGHS